LFITRGTSATKTETIISANVDSGLQFGSSTEAYLDGVEWLETLPGWTKWGVPGQLGLLGLVSATILERTTEILGKSGPPDPKVIRELLAAIKFLQVCVPWSPQQYLPS
jgi:hypothetical protein